MFCSPKKEDDQKRKSNDIDHWLVNEDQQTKKIIQLLLLGTGESGKSTIIKQMKILHINGFSENEKKEKIPNIRQNIHESIYALVYHMDKISPPINLKNQESKEPAQFILRLDHGEPTEYNDEYFDYVKTLWADPGVKEAFNRANEFQLIDSAPHFLDRIDDVRSPNYIPTVQDMLFCRITTIGLSKIEFTVPYKRNNIKFWMYDVGGQRGERKKWIQVFEGINGILFLIAASDFDQNLREDENRNRLVEALQVFNDIFWSGFLKSAGKIVFLNKQDLLERKIEQGKCIENYFPEYNEYTLTDKKGKEYTKVERARNFFKHKIIEISKSPPKGSIFIPVLNISSDKEEQQVYIHFTIATDTNNIKLVFNDVKDMIFTRNLKDITM